MARNKFLMIDISPLQGLSAVVLMNSLGRCPKLLNFAPLGAYRSANSAHFPESIIS